MYIIARQPVELKKKDGNYLEITLHFKYEIKYGE